MEKIYFRLVFNSENNLNADTLGTVVIEARQFSEKVYLPTNVSLKPEYWNSYSQEVNSTHPNHELLNRYLQECILKLEWQELKMWKNDTPMTLEQLTMPDIRCNEAKESSFLNFCKEYIHISRKRESTKRNLMTTVKVLSIFNCNTSFNNITYEYIMNFEKFLFARKYKINTIIKHIKHLRSFYNEAVNRKLINNSDDAFRRYKMLKGESQYTFLLPEELNKLEKLVLAKKNRNMQHTLDAFLFCCYTGLRYSDFCSLTKDNLMNIDDKIWLMYKSVKTGVETRLPLYLLFNGKAISILNKYKHNMNSFFKISSNSSIDKELKRIKALAGVNTHISFHTARHTNATLLVYKGVNITTVQKLLGHKNIRTTQHYADILPQGIVKDLEKNA